MIIYYKNLKPINIDKVIFVEKVIYEKEKTFILKFIFESRVVEWNLKDNKDEFDKLYHTIEKNYFIQIKLGEETQKATILNN